MEPRRLKTRVKTAATTPTRAGKPSAGKPSASSSVPGKDPKKVVTGPCRSTFMKVLKLMPGKKDPTKETCSTGIIISKDDEVTVKKIKNAISVACREAFGDAFNPWKSTKLKNPLRDGDELLDDPDNKIGEEIANAYLLNTKSYRLPEVVNKSNQPIEDRDDLADVCVSGYFFRFSLYFKANEVETDEGGKIKVVNCYLNNIMFVKKGEKLAGGSSATDDFADYAEEYEEEEEDEEYDD